MYSRYAADTADRVSINHMHREQHPRHCWGNEWGMYSRHAADTAD